MPAVCLRQRQHRLWGHPLWGAQRVWAFLHPRGRVLPCVWQIRQRSWMDWWAIPTVSSRGRHWVYFHLSTACWKDMTTSTDVYCIRNLGYVWNIYALSLTMRPQSIRQIGLTRHSIIIIIQKSSRMPINQWCNTIMCKYLLKIKTFHWIQHFTIRKHREHGQRSWWF